MIFLALLVFAEGLRIDGSRKALMFGSVPSRAYSTCGYSWHATSTLGVAVGFKSVRRRRNKLTATQPWDEDDSDLGASLRKLFSATARNRAASLGKTPREARKRILTE
jgi:hypothetical protein